MKKSDEKYNKTIEILNDIKSKIESKYAIENVNYIEAYDSLVYTRLSFELVTPYRNVKIEINRNYNYKREMNISFKFEKPRRRSKNRGLTGGYAIKIYDQSNDNECDYVNEIDFDTMFKEIDKVLENIKEDGTWCDESEYDD